MRRTLSFIGSLALLTALVLTVTELPLVARAVPTTAAQQFKTQPLYRYQSRKGHYLYATTAKLPADLSDGPWESEGIACYVPEAKPHGTKPVYQLSSSSNDLGIRYFFTSKASEVASAQTTGWANQGVVFYVADTKLPGTVPFYRLYKPVVPQKKKDNSIFGKISEAIAGPKFTQSTADILQDAHFYTMREDEKAVALQGGFVEVGILGYVWQNPVGADATETAPAANLPDLQVEKILNVKDSSVTVSVRNSGAASVSSHAIEITLSAYDANNKLAFSLTAVMEQGLSPQQARPYTLDTQGKSLAGRTFQVTVDPANKITEANEGNNRTKPASGPFLIDPKIAAGLLNPLPPPKLLFLGSRDPSKGQDGRAILYDLGVENWKEYPAELFAPAPGLPACGSRKESPRSWVYLYNQDDKQLAQICFLTSAQGLTRLAYGPRPGEPRPQQIYVVIEDRQTGKRYKSNGVPLK